ncbi:hypothetical protein [Nocardia sp. NPDC050793]|uniref:hypothetical protein n=1 Tax=Nocardia sp. NPDC050793 TaxID=3155159 RepID=UPI0033D4F203
MAGSKLRMLAAITVAAGAAWLTAVATGGQAQAVVGNPCLWAGEVYEHDKTITAGGWSYTCGVGSYGGPQWFRGQPVGEHSTVANPGARSNPAGRFSPGAQQPGTDYNDYCVGDQLIEGADDIYEVVVDHRGFQWWKAAGPISRWTFGAGEQRPGTSWRSSSMCYDGVLS